MVTGRAFRLVAASAVVVAVVGCSGDDGGDGDDGQASGGAGGAAGSGGSGASSGEVKTPQLEAGWNEFRPGGDTVCSRGSEFAYWVHPGTVNKVVIDYIGGGACWNAVTCSVADAIFSDSVDQVRTAIEANIPVGIYDKTRDDNPFKDWYHVVIPYCTGDVHWGDATVEYSDSVTIEHRGATNGRAVLDWVKAEFSAPEQIMVTGCSAGSYGSLGWAPHIMEHYKDSQVFQFGDSGAGVITESFFRDAFPSWNATAFMPRWIDSLNPDEVDVFSLELADLYIRLGEAYPNNLLSQYNTTFDENQTFYYDAMGGENGAQGWSEKMLSSMSRIRSDTPNFRSFQASGEQHCIIVANNFYTVEAGGVKLTDWLQDMIDGKDIDNVACEDCSAPTPE